MVIDDKIRECFDLRDPESKEYVCPDNHALVYKITRRFHPSCPPVEFGECIDQNCRELVSLSDYLISDPLGVFDYSTPDRLERRILYIRKGVKDDE